MKFDHLFPHFNDLDHGPLKYFHHLDVNWSNVGRTLLAGAIAGGVSRTVTAPLDRLKYVKQVGNSTTMLDGAHVIYNEGGLRGFWRGNFINCLKVVPESALKFFAFESLKPIFTSRLHHELQLHERLVAGSFAGMVANACVYPLETIKTRLATNTGTRVTFGSVCRQLWAEGGVPAFYKGMSASLIGIVPYAGVDLAVYDSLRIFVAHDEAARKWALLADGQMTTASILACAAISASCAQTFSYPIAVLRTRMQVAPNSTNIVAMATLLYAQQGVKAFYAGFVPNALVTFRSLFEA
jgi:solute carrier family 25 phosphate transporter 23/24/25/41